MKRNAAIQRLEQPHLKTDIPIFHVGDTVAVHTRIIEGNKERTQVFTGTVIARKGSGLSETFSLHRVAYGEGIERVFLLHSPRIAKIVLMQEGDVRRAKLYNLRGTSGKKAKVKRRVVSRFARKGKKTTRVDQEPIDAKTLEGNGAPAEEIAETVKVETTTATASDTESTETSSST